MLLKVMSTVMIRMTLPALEKKLVHWGEKREVEAIGFPYTHTHIHVTNLSGSATVSDS